MSKLYTREHYSPFISELMNAINADANIVPVLEQVIADISSPTMSDFWFSDTLTPAEVTYFDEFLNNFMYTQTGEEPLADTYSDVIGSGTWYGISNSFVRNGDNLQSSLSTAPTALGDGEIVAVSISSKNDNSNFFVQLIKNPRPGGGGEWGGGDQVGVDLEKPIKVINKVYERLTGFPFDKGDQLAIYIKRGKEGNGVADSPMIRLYLRYY